VAGRKRILIACMADVPGTGGGVTRSGNLARGLKARGREVSIVTKADQPPVEDHGMGGIATRFFLLDAGRAWRVPSLTWPAQSRVAAVAAAGLVLSRATTPGHAARGGRYCSLAALPLESYKKEARGLWAHLAFLDESGFLLIPARRGTRGPEGRTPIVPYSREYDRVSALDTVTISQIDGHVGLCARFQQDDFKAVHVAPFLRTILARLTGPVILSWDQGQIHKGPAIRQVFLDYPRLQTEWFARYARNSIRPSRSGTSSRATRPTACRWTSRIFETAFIPILGGFAVAEPNYDPSFWLWNCSHRSVDAYSITFVRFESGGRCAVKGGTE